MVTVFIGLSPVADLPVWWPYETDYIGHIVLFKHILGHNGLNQYGLPDIEQHERDVKAIWQTKITGKPHNLFDSLLGILYR